MEIPITRRKSSQERFQAAANKQRENERPVCTSVALSSSETWKKSAVMHKAWYRTSHLHLCRACP
jgi:hypothetical protein